MWQVSSGLAGEGPLLMEKDICLVSPLSCTDPWFDGSLNPCDTARIGSLRSSTHSRDGSHYRCSHVSHDSCLFYNVTFFIDHLSPVFSATASTPSCFPPKSTFSYPRHPSSSLPPSPTSLLSPASGWPLPGPSTTLPPTSSSSCSLPPGSYTYFTTTTPMMGESF